MPLSSFKGGRAAGGLRRLDAGSWGLGRSVIAAQFGKAMEGDDGLSDPANAHARYQISISPFNGEVKVVFPPTAGALAPVGRLKDTLWDFGIAMKGYN